MRRQFLPQHVNQPGIAKRICRGNAQHHYRVAGQHNVGFGLAGSLLRQAGRQLVIASSLLAGFGNPDAKIQC